jgi:hypothetical protein
MTTNDPRCTWENKFRIALAKTAFDKDNCFFFGSKLGLKLMKKLVNCHIWSVALVLRLGHLGQ